MLDLETYIVRWEAQLRELRGEPPVLRDHLADLLAGGSLDPQIAPADAVIELALLRRVVDEPAALAAIDRALDAAIRAHDDHHRRLRDRLAGLLGHDLANPLHAILMSVGVLLADRDLSPGHQAVAGRLQRSTERARRVMGDVLDFARAQLGGAMSIAPRRCDLGALCRAAVAEVTAAYPDAAIELAADGALDGVVDPPRVTQALVYLLGGALELGAAGVRLTATVEPDRVVTAVSHARAPDLATLLDPYRRASEKQQRRGTGLELHVVEQIARAHGAALEVRGAALAIAWPRG